jgi:nucleoside-diphosphate-sugar epimerase
MNLQSKRVLVTGADGFIGSHLVEHLVRGGACVLISCGLASVFSDYFGSIV